MHLAPRPHTNWFSKGSVTQRDPVRRALLEWIFSELAKETVNISELSRESRVKRTTLSTWRQKLKVDPNYRPDPNALGRHLALPEEVEQELADHIRKEYIAKGRMLTMSSLSALARAAYNELNETSPEDKGREFKASNNWDYGFLGRREMALRTPHMKRRTVPDDTQVAKFLQEMEVAMFQFRKDLTYIINVDESAWHTLPNVPLVIADRGADEVVCFTDADEKECITIIAGITMAGDKLPLWGIARGKTVRCEEKFRTNERLSRALERNELLFTHQVSGWSDIEVVKAYIDWLSADFLKGRPALLVWDVYASHRCDEVRQFAADRNIGITFIPAGMTGTWQPLDYRIFGALKNRARSIYTSAVALHPERTYTLLDAVATLLDCWKQTTQEEVIGAWRQIIDVDMGLDQD